jgi:hypothetical protein
MKKNNWFMSWIERLSNKTVKVMEFKPIPPETVVEKKEPEIQKFPGHTNPPPPPPQPENKLKVRVEPYDKDCKYYMIKYLSDGHWRTLEKNILYDSSIDLCDFHFPVLISDFDDAVKKANNLTEESIKKDIEERTLAFDDHINEIKKRVQIRNKRWEN